MDTGLLELFNQTLSHPLLDLLMIGLTTLGLAILPLSGIGLIWRGSRRLGLTVLVALVVSLLVVVSLQFVILRPRPENVRLLYPSPVFPAYPSGHAAAAFSTALVVSLACRRTVWGVLFFLAAGAIAFSRVYLGHHYPSDILGGAIIGLAIGALSYGLLVERRRGARRWAWLLWPQLAVVIIVSQVAYLGLIPLYFRQWPYIDKGLHFLLFGAVAFWLNLWWAGWTIPLGDWTLPLAVVLPFGVALLEEFAQQLSPYRSLDPLDLACDLGGIVLFWWISRQFIPPDAPESGRVDR